VLAEAPDALAGVKSLLAGDDVVADDRQLFENPAAALALILTLVLRLLRHARPSKLGAIAKTDTKF